MCKSENMRFSIIHILDITELLRKSRQCDSELRSEKIYKNVKIENNRISISCTVVQHSTSKLIDCGLNFRAIQKFYPLMYNLSDNMSEKVDFQLKLEST